MVKARFDTLRKNKEILRKRKGTKAKRQKDKRTAMTIREGRSLYAFQRSTRGSVHRRQPRSHALRGSARRTRHVHILKLLNQRKKTSIYLIFIRFCLVNAARSLSVPTRRVGTSCVSPKTKSACEQCRHSRASGNLVFPSTLGFPLTRE